MSLGSFLRDQRRIRQWSLKELGEKLRSPRTEGGLSPQYLNDVEHDRRTPSDDVLQQLAEVLSADVSMLRALAQKSPPEVERYLAEHADVSAKVGQVFRRAQQAGFRDWDKVDDVIIREKAARRKKK